MEEKLLIYFPEDKLQPTGGPAGYLWNLNKGLHEVDSGCLKIEFYKNAPARFEDNDRLRQMVPKRMLEFRRALAYTKFLNKNLPIDNSMYEYDAIHFHSTEDMFLNRGFLNEYRGKVILTSHSPCAKNKEKIARLNPKDYLRLRSKIDRLEEFDLYAFERADYIIFPCEDAEEPYYHTWDRYRDVRDPSKYRYLPTGIVGCNAKVSRSDFRKKYNIPENAFVISYVGRHNEIKGYADLIRNAETILRCHENVYFLIGGKEEPIVGLNDSRWVEVGWTNDPHSLINAADLFVLPNRETYFDLILLEVMSLGIPVLMTNTGGNKFFERFNTDSLHIYRNTDEFFQWIEFMLTMEENEKKKLMKEEIKVFQQNFTIDIFSRNYVELIKSIMGGTNDAEQ